MVCNFVRLLLWISCNQNCSFRWRSINSQWYHSVWRHGSIDQNGLIQFLNWTSRIFRNREQSGPWIPHEGFAGWISTGKSEINFIFEPFGYNYGFDIEWRCVPESVPDIRESAIIETEIMILRGVKRGIAPNYIYYDFPQEVLNWNQTIEQPIRTIDNLFDLKLTDQVRF